MAGSGWQNVRKSKTADAWPFKKKEWEPPAGWYPDYVLETEFTPAGRLELKARGSDSSQGFQYHLRLYDSRNALVGYGIAIGYDSYHQNFDTTDAQLMFSLAKNMLDEGYSWDQVRALAGHGGQGLFDAIPKGNLPGEDKSQGQQLNLFGKRQSGIPATYTDEDPLGMDTTLSLIDDLHTAWWEGSPEEQKVAIANAFRAALVSPRQNLMWNSIVYQDLMHVPPEESDPQVFEDVIRKAKEKWDSFGQQTMDTVEQHTHDPELLAHLQNGGVSKYLPGIWKNVRNCAIIGPYIEQLRQAGMDDIAQGGDGRVFRQQLMEMNIPGIGPKIAAFVWLLLAPKSSKLATIDIHMMRHLGQPVDSPKDYTAYLNFEQQLDDQRKQMGYDQVPLGAFQWALWDRQRTPGYHQDHTPLRPVNPVDWRNIQWATTPSGLDKYRAQPKILDPQPEEQQQLFPTEGKVRAGWALKRVTTG
jgi:hypothetical protein